MTSVVESSLGTVNGQVESEEWHREICNGVSHTNFMKFKVFARLKARVCVFVKGGPDSLRACTQISWLSSQIGQLSLYSEFQRKIVCPRLE